MSAQESQARRDAAGEPRVAEGACRGALRFRPRLRGWSAAALLAALLAAWAPAALAGDSAVGDPVAGEEAARRNVCLECHAADGAVISPEYPRLAGQRAPYLLKQLRDFQSGARRHRIMNGMVDGIADAELADIAAFFAGGPPLRGAPAAEDPETARLYAAGDAARGVPACAACHGAAGQGGAGGDGAIPAIGGQHRFYLRGQLLDWKNGVRANSDGGVMNAATRGLGTAEIDALAAYLAGLQGGEGPAATPPAERGVQR